MKKKKKIKNFEKMFIVADLVSLSVFVGKYSIETV